LLAPALALSTGCGRSDAPQERRIVPHPVRGCAVTLSSGLVLTALGDFSDTTAAASLSDPSARSEVRLPFNLRGVATTSMSGARGVGYADPPADVHLSLWSSTESCTPIDDEIPASHGGQAMAPFADGTAVVLAGLDPALPGNDATLGLAWDTRTGEELAPKGGLGANRRAFASATQFGSGALIAGGIDKGEVSERLIDSAIVFRDGEFKANQALIPLGDPRARHGAIVLADGSTLLVGGETDNHLALPSLVQVVPTDEPPFGRAILFGLGTLRTPRSDPTVLRLADDTILVAAGFDSMNQPVPTLEWFTKEGFACNAVNRCPGVQTLPVRQRRAFVALAAGGALTIGIDSDPSTQVVTSDVWWITPQGDIQPLAPLSDGQLPRFDATLQRARNIQLVPASDGSPRLWNGSSWFRFDPWLATFVAADPAPADGPDDDLPIISVDPGLMVWLQRERVDRDAGSEGGAGTPDAAVTTDLVTKVRGFRHDVRGSMVRDTKFVLVDRDPQHLVPDQPPGHDLRIESDGAHLVNGATIAIPDATFADVVIQGKTRSASLPGIRLGSELAVGSDPCSWSSSSEAGAGANNAAATTEHTFEVKRTGTRLELLVDNAPLRTCPDGPAGRVSVGLTALGPSPVVIAELTVTRTAAP
jgi:hypothetical protein